MRRIIIAVILAMVSTLAFAQKALFDKYDDVDGVSTVYISRNMLHMMGNVKAGDKDISNIAKRLDHLQILSCERPSMVTAIRKTASAIYRQQKFSVVMQVNDDGEHTTIYERHHANGKNEFALLSYEHDEISIINILGNVTLQDIQGIAGGK
ncbi:MAG: DUF4252 domain-containing protein [Prevotella sp.]|nr:DUF4252 domain-containing protein [Prevotella sp.]